MKLKSRLSSAFSGLAAAAALAFLGVAPARAAQPMPPLQATVTGAVTYSWRATVTSIKCISTADWDGEDEIFIEAEITGDQASERIWGLAYMSANETVAVDAPPSTSPRNSKPRVITATSSRCGTRVARSTSRSRSGSCC